jgi:hypothetical protein
LREVEPQPAATPTMTTAAKTAGSMAVRTRPSLETA